VSVGTEEADNQRDGDDVLVTTRGVQEEAETKTRGLILRIIELVVASIIMVWYQKCTIMSRVDTEAKMQPVV
jgi:hypothetical protein